MIAVEVLRLKTQLSRRRSAVAIGLALAAALMRAGRFERVEARMWRGVPDLAHVSGEKVDIELGNYVDVGVVGGIARRRGWDGVTITLDGELGGVRLGVDIDIYASEYVPVLAGITSRGVDVLAEPRGHVEGRVVESFYELFDVEREKMRAVAEELFTEMKRVAVGERPLWRLVARVYALRDYSFAPEDAMPLWYRPWVRQFAKYLYRLAPPGLRELVGPIGMVKAVRDAAAELLKRLERSYEVKQYEDALQLIPLSAESHRAAVAELRSVVVETIKEATGNKALKIIEEKGYLDWGEYVNAFGEELRLRL